MSDLSDFDAPKKPWLTALIPASVIFLAAGAYWAFTSGDADRNSGIEHGITANTGDRLILGKSYFIPAIKRVNHGTEERTDRILNIKLNGLVTKYLKVQ